MDDVPDRQKATELLQQLGLKEYEAKAFVALARLPKGTAKRISEISEVPRTRVYDAARVLETKGLVEVQHSNPQEFRAVSVDEAVGTLRGEYRSRMNSLRRTLDNLEQVEDERETDVTHEVWSLSGTEMIETRTQQLIDDAAAEVVLVLGARSVFTDSLAGRLAAAAERDADVIVGTSTSELQQRVADELPGVETFVSDLEWLHQSPSPDDDTEITRLLLVDQEAILVSVSQTDTQAERAVFGRGFSNGLVAIVRRLLAIGLLPRDGAGQTEE
jgi:sugar-specific transcriptional regulator TrmB